MGLIGEVQTDLAAAFDDDLADLVIPFTLIKIAKGSYNTTTAKHATIKEYFDSRGVFSHYDTKELTDEIKIGDIKLICLANEIDETPEIDDLIDQDDKEYIIKNVKPIQGIAYKVHIRGS